VRAVLLLAAVALLPGDGELAAQTARLGLEIEGKSVTGTANANGTGVLGGLRGARSLGASGVAGLAGYGGPMLGRATGQGGMGYGGAFVGVKTRTEGGADLELTLLVGGGGSSGSPDGEDGGIAVQPELRAFFHAGGERSVTEVARALRAPQPLASKHLRVLRRVGLVRVRRDGHRRLYALNAARLKPMHDWISYFERFWVATFDRLDQYLGDVPDDDR
jgi:DNA-binding transcriptional ArsR family regulator